MEAGSPPLHRSRIGVESGSDPADATPGGPGEERGGPVAGRTTLKSLSAGEGTRQSPQRTGDVVMTHFETFQVAIQVMPRMWGYLDPGMGSMALQVLLAGLLSSMFFVKSWFRQVRDAFGAKTRNS